MKSTQKCSAIAIARAHLDGKVKGGGMTPSPLVRAAARELKKRADDFLLRNPGEEVSLSPYMHALMGTQEETSIAIPIHA